MLKEAYNIKKVSGPAARGNIHWKKTTGKVYFENMIENVLKEKPWSRTFFKKVSLLIFW